MLVRSLPFLLVHILKYSKTPLIRIETASLPDIQKTRITGFFFFGGGGEWKEFYKRLFYAKHLFTYK
jgi:hypothetical protein